MSDFGALVFRLLRELEILKDHLVAIEAASVKFVNSTSRDPSSDVLSGLQSVDFALQAIDGISTFLKAVETHSDLEGVIDFEDCSRGVLLNEMRNRLQGLTGGHNLQPAVEIYTNSQTKRV